MNTTEIFPGAFHAQAFLSRAEQRDLTDYVNVLAAGPIGFYRPQVRGGGYMRCEMLCLGRHWNAKTYSYEMRRSDADGSVVLPVPTDFVMVAARAAAEVGFVLDPDICIINRYSQDGKMGLHQDKDEHRSTLDAGVPIVSLSLGSTARFVVGGSRRREQTKAIALQSGDAFVMGGPSRLRYHGITRILKGTGPLELGIPGRLSLTFRQYQLEK